MQQCHSVPGGSLAGSSATSRLPEQKDTASAEGLPMQSWPNTRSTLDVKIWRCLEHLNALPEHAKLSPCGCAVKQLGMSNGGICRGPQGHATPSMHMHHLSSSQHLLQMQPTPCCMLLIA